MARPDQARAGPLYARYCMYILSVYLSKYKSNNGYDFEIYAQVIILELPIVLVKHFVTRHSARPGPTFYFVHQH